MDNIQQKSKEPWLAVVLSSIIAGIGQIYSGRVSKGIILITTQILLLSVSILTILDAKCDILITMGILFILVVIFIWNLFDAHQCVRKINSEEFEAERKLSKDPWLAVFLSRLIPGLGQLYLRKWSSDIFFIIIGVFIIIVLYEHPLFGISLWAFFITLVCFHAYMTTPLRRQKSNTTIITVAILILCFHLLGYIQLISKKYIVETFEMPTYLSFVRFPIRRPIKSPMYPTINSGDRIFIRKSKKYLPKRGDVVAVIRIPNSGLYVRRVAALPGEIIEIKNKKLYINGQKISHPAFGNIEPISVKVEIKEPLYVPENHYFLIGDNTSTSHDSRISGPVHRSNITGKAYKIYWPLSRRGPIE